jgi:hypothetical protein
MNSLEILYSNGQFDEVKVFINQQLVNQAQQCNAITVEFNHALPVNIDVEFWPFRIKPIVRYNNFMLDYWLGDILLQDHKLTITITSNFFEQYRNNNIQGRIDSLSEKQKKTKHFFDQYVGVNNGYPALIKQIKKLIDR